MQSRLTQPDVGRELLVLGVVRRKQLSAYLIDRTVRNHSPLYRPLGLGNVYHLVERLHKGGYLSRQTAKARRGPSASKSVFDLSPSGDRRFRVLLRRVLCDPQSNDSALEIALVLLGQLPRTEAVEMLAQRDDELAAQERRVKRLFGDMELRSGPGYLAGAHALQRVQSERSFLQTTLKQLQNPRWHSEWVLDDGPVEDPNRRL